MDSQPKRPPSYPRENEEVHNHFYQIQADDQRPLPWYRKKKCIYISFFLAIISFIIIVVAVTLNIVLNRKGNQDHQTTSVPTSVLTVSVTPKISTSESSTSSTSSTPSSSSSPVVLTSMVVTSSVVTVTLTHSEESKAVETTVLTVTATNSEEDDIGEMLSSMFSSFPFIATEVVTVSHTAEEDISTTTSTSTEESPSTTSSSTSTTSTKISSSPSASANPPTLSNKSQIAAVDVNIGPSNLHRRLVLWQDQEDNLIARDSSLSSDEIKVYHLGDYLDVTKKPLPGTHLTAAADDKGAIHVFYLSNGGDEDDEKVALIHFVQREAGKWEATDEDLVVTQGSSLSATWHHNGNSTPAVLLAFQSPVNIYLYLVDVSDQDSDAKGALVDVSALLGLESGDWDAMGMSIASGFHIVTKDDANREGKVGDYAGLYFLFEGIEEVLVAQCSINPGAEKDHPHHCSWLTTAFTDASGNPIKITSHPTRLSWTLRRPDSGAPPIIYGFLTLDDQGSTINDHRIVPKDNISPRAAATTTSEADEPHITMETYNVEEADIEAMAMTDERTLLVRAGTRLFEFSFAEDGWQDRKEIDTALSTPN